MKTIKDLKASMPQHGKVEWIGIRSKRKADVTVKDAITVTIESGISGDHYSKQDGKRMVTLIQAEHLKVVQNILGKEIDPASLRRNIVVSGINVHALQEVRFQIGEVILQGTGFCHPCSRMETNLGPGGYNAMRGHGGITAKVIQGGDIKTSNKVEKLPQVNT